MDEDKYDKKEEAKGEREKEAKGKSVRWKVRKRT